MNILNNSWKFVRAHQWWNYKFPLPLAAAYAVAYAENIPFYLLILPFTLVILIGIAAAIYASVINDYMDLEQDRVSGKMSLMMSLSPLQRKCVVAASVLLNVYVAYGLRFVPATLSCFLLITAIFSFYSIQPFRLKERGAAGIISISFGEHVVPALLAVCLVVELSGKSLPVPLVIAIAGWAGCFGCRGIIWHQLCDLAADQEANCKTFGVLMGKKKLTLIGERIVFPLELICLGAIFWLTRNPWSLVFLALYGLVSWMRARYMEQKYIIVEANAQGHFILFEYYQLYLPLSFLFAVLISQPIASLYITVFCLLFIGPIAFTIFHLVHIIKGLIRSRPRSETRPKQS